MDQEAEDPLALCEAWARVAAPTPCPASLTALALNKVKIMINIYPTLPAGQTQKSEIRRGLRNLLDLPLQFVPDLLGCVLVSMQVYIYNQNKNVFLNLSIYLNDSILLRGARITVTRLWISSSSLRFKEIYKGRAK